MMRAKYTEVIDEAKRIVISKAHVRKFRLPEKALGVWVVVGKSIKGYRLRKVRLDGVMMSDKLNNHQVISERMYKDIAGVIEVGYGTGNVDNLDEVFAKLTVRKKAWIARLIKAMSTDKNLSKVLQSQGEAKVALKILEDTDIGREKGKAYSSIDGALKVWRMRYAV